MIHHAIKGHETLAATIRSQSELSRVAQEVGRALRGRLRRLTIEGGERGLILRGEAPTFYVKQLAQHAVTRSCGRTIARNDIEVIQPI